MLRLLIALVLLLPLGAGEASDATARHKGRCRKCACSAFAGPGFVCKRAACRHHELMHKIR